MFPGNEKILRIKAPVVERLKRKNFAGALPGVAFKTAGYIHHAQPQ